MHVLNSSEQNLPTRSSLSTKLSRGASRLLLLVSTVGLVALTGCSDVESKFGGRDGRGDGSGSSNDGSGDDFIDDDDGQSTGSSSSNGGDDVCAEAAATFTERQPYVMLLVDQSGSMNEDFGSGTRWTVMRDALLHPTQGIISRMEDRVRFGLALYTSDNGYEGGQCPIVNDVAASFGNYQAIAAQYNAAEPFDDTPTGESLALITAELDKMPIDDDTPKVIVLATDGEPDTCAEPDPQKGQAESLLAAMMAHAAGIQTYVISVGNEVGDAHLQQMANAGVGLPIDGAQKAKFYKALNNAELQEAFETIVNGVRGCIFDLDGTVTPGSEGHRQSDLRRAIATERRSQWLAAQRQQSDPVTRRCVRDHSRRRTRCAGDLFV